MDPIITPMLLSSAAKIAWAKYKQMEEELKNLDNVKSGLTPVQLKMRLDAMQLLLDNSFPVLEKLHDSFNNQEAKIANLEKLRDNFNCQEDRITILEKALLECKKANSQTTLSYIAIALSSVAILCVIFV